MFLWPFAHWKVKSVLNLSWGQSNHLRNLPDGHAVMLADYLAVVADEIPHIEELFLDLH
jgi:hypothetical protein